MRRRRFKNAAELARAAAELLAQHLAPRSGGRPRAVMLAGGETPWPAYRALAAAAPPIGEECSFFLSDERHVPFDRPESNYGRIRTWLAGLGITEDRLLGVHTELNLEAAAHRYHRDLAALLKSGAPIPLGFLGLGADGHTASLFTPDDLRRGAGLFAVAVRRPGGPDRISVTPELLARIEQIVFLVSGRAKDAVVEQLLRDPELLPAGRAVAGVRNVALWQA